MCTKTLRNRSSIGGRQHKQTGDYSSPRFLSGAHGGGHGCWHLRTGIDLPRLSRATWDRQWTRTERLVSRRTGRRQRERPPSSRHRVRISRRPRGCYIRGPRGRVDRPDSPACGLRTGSCDPLRRTSRRRNTHTDGCRPRPRGPRRPRFGSDGTRRESDTAFDPRPPRPQRPECSPAGYRTASATARVQPHRLSNKNFDRSRGCNCHPNAFLDEHHFDTIP